ncbi:transcription factor TFIIF complex subunit Tfg3, partial [Coemansia sp. RSA 1722]
MLLPALIVVSRAPFSVQEEGWGEFDLDIVVHFHHCAETLRIVHDLNFHEGESYFKQYELTIPNPSAAFLNLFNKRSPVSRKTIPSRGSKARKGPPRDSVYSKNQHSPHSSESLDTLSANEHSFSDSDDNSDGNASASASDSDMDSHSSRSAASKSRSVSSASMRRAKEISARSSGSFRPSFSTKHVPQPGAVGSASQQPGTVSHKQRPSLSTNASRSLQSDHAAAHIEESRHQRTPSTSVRPSSRPDRDAMPGARRTSNAVPAALGGMAKHRANAAPADRKPASVMRDRSLEKSLSPVNPTDRPTGSAVSGVKRRLSDALDNPSSKPPIRRRTLAPGDARTSSVSPPLVPADARADTALPASRRPLASGIAKVRVPKKRDRLLADDRDRDRDLEPPPTSKTARAAIGSSRRPASRPTDVDEHMSSPPSSHQQQGAALTSREIFIRERERQRYLEQARDAAAAGSTGIRANAAKPVSSLSSSSSSTSSMATAAGLSRGMRAAASSTAATAAALPKSSKPAAPAFSDDEPVDRPVESA